MREIGQQLKHRADSLEFRIKGLTHLRRLVDLTGEQDITERQWSVLEPQLSAASAQLVSRVKAASSQYLPRANDAKVRRRLNAALGRVELDMARAFTFFDTYMDILTQRRSQELGAMLAGCDVLASEAIRRDHPALASVEPPLVFCDRGMGAAIARESVPFPDGSPNPMPLIQIPYSRLREKRNLTSILHEAGHQALQRLALVGPMADAVREALDRAGVAPEVRDLYGLWSSEIGPDFWAFCLAGVAEAAAVRDLFAMQPAHALRISVTDPHPPPYLRALLTFDWCKHVWGTGVWDEWDQEWRTLYPLDNLPPSTRDLLIRARRAIRVVGDALFNKHFDQLGGRALPDLFDLSSVSPSKLTRIASSAQSGVLDLKGLSPCVQLAAFGRLRGLRSMGEEELDRIMTRWLWRLGARRHTLH